jgi:hypothetical protein
MYKFIAAATAGLVLCGTALAQTGGTMGVSGTDAKADVRGSATAVPDRPIERAVDAPAATPNCPPGVPTTYETEPKSSVNCIPPASEKASPSTPAGTDPVAPASATGR